MRTSYALAIERAREQGRQAKMEPCNHGPIERVRWLVCRSCKTLIFDGKRREFPETQSAALKLIDEFFEVASQEKRPYETPTITDLGTLQDWDEDTGP